MSAAASDASVAFPHGGARCNYFLPGQCQQEKSSPTPRPLAGHSRPLPGHAAQPSRCPPLPPRVSGPPAFLKRARWTGLLSPLSLCSLTGASRPSPPGRYLRQRGRVDLAAARARAHAQTHTRRTRPRPLSRPHTLPHTHSPQSWSRAGRRWRGDPSPLENRAARPMSTGDQWRHGVPISDGRTLESGAQILCSPAPSARRHSHRAPGGGRGAGWRGGARLRARAAAGPCAPRLPVHGRPGDRRAALELPSESSRQTPPPLSPTGIFLFSSTRIWSLPVDPSVDWPPVGPKRAAPGARGRGRAG